MKNRKRNRAQIQFLMARVIVFCLISAHMAAVMSGCGKWRMGMRKVDAILVDPVSTGKQYAAFVAENQELLNQIYTRKYETCFFIVDTENGSTAIQTLIRPTKVMGLVETLGMASMSDREKIQAAVRHIYENYRYVPEPQVWPFIDDTLRMRRGDCKGLSLLLMSVLLAGNVEVYISVSNHHMWVNAYADGQWHVLETDRDAERNQVYGLPGFYESPLYRIFSDHSEKRKRMK